MTATEAKLIADNNNKNFNRMYYHISLSAQSGNYATNFYYLSNEEQDELKNKGYIIVPAYYGFTVSWSK